MVFCVKSSSGASFLCELQDGPQDLCPLFTFLLQLACPKEVSRCEIYGKQSGEHTKVCMPDCIGLRITAGNIS
jgi:hypothetical protein